MIHKIKSYTLCILPSPWEYIQKVKTEKQQHNKHFIEIWNLNSVCPDRRRFIKWVLWYSVSVIRSKVLNQRIPFDLFSWHLLLFFVFIFFLYIRYWDQLEQFSNTRYMHHQHVICIDSDRYLIYLILNIERV